MLLASLDDVVNFVAITAARCRLSIFQSLHTLLDFSRNCLSNAIILSPHNEKSKINSQTLLTNIGQLLKMRFAVFRNYRLNENEECGSTQIR